MDRIYVFGPKASLLAGRDDLYFRSSSADSVQFPDGERLAPAPLPHERSNPVAYLLHRINTAQLVEDPLSSKINVQVMDILDAARESVRAGRPKELK
jgi:hypothetical protein